MDMTEIPLVVCVEKHIHGMFFLRIAVVRLELVKAQTSKKDSATEPR